MAPRPYFALKNPMSTRKNFFLIYRQFEHMPSKRFASAALNLSQRHFVRQKSDTDCLGQNPRSIQKETLIRKSGTTRQKSDFP